MSIYDCLDEMVKATLLEFDGRQTPLQIVRTAGRSVSSTTGKFVSGSDENINVTGIVSPYKKGQRNGVDIQDGDLLVIIDSTIEPLSSDSFLIDGDNYAVVAIERIRPSYQTMLYKVQVRR